MGAPKLLTLALERNPNAAQRMPLRSLGRLFPRIVVDAPLFINASAPSSRFDHVRHLRPEYMAAELVSRFRAASAMPIVVWPGSWRAPEKQQYRDNVRRRMETKMQQYQELEKIHQTQCMRVIQLQQLVDKNYEEDDNLNKETNKWKQFVGAEGASARPNLIISEIQQQVLKAREDDSLPEKSVDLFYREEALIRTMIKRNTLDHENIKDASSGYYANVITKKIRTEPPVEILSKKALKAELNSLIGDIADYTIKLNRLLSSSLQPEEKERLRDALKSLGVPLLVAEGTESKNLAAALVSDGLADAVASESSELVAMDVPLVRGMTRRLTGPIASHPNVERSNTNSYENQSQSNENNYPNKTGRFNENEQIKHETLWDFILKAIGYPFFRADRFHERSSKASITYNSELKARITRQNAFWTLLSKMLRTAKNDEDNRNFNLEGGADLPNLQQSSFASVPFGDVVAFDPKAIREAIGFTDHKLFLEVYVLASSVFAESHVPGVRTHRAMTIIKNFGSLEKFGEAIQKVLEKDSKGKIELEPQVMVGPVEAQWIEKTRQAVRLLNLRPSTTVARRELANQIPFWEEVRPQFSQKVGELGLSFEELRNVVSNPK